MKSRKSFRLNFFFTLITTLILTTLPTIKAANSEEETTTLKVKECNEMLQITITERDECLLRVEDLQEQIDDLNTEMDKMSDSKDSCRFRMAEDGYACAGLNIEIEDEDDQEIDWEGDHTGSNSDDDVKVFLLSSQSTTLLPLEVGKTFRFLTTFIVQKSGLEELRKGDFAYVENIEKLVITGNNLTLIEAGVFEPLKRMKHIDLRANNIRSLPSKAFEKMPDLEFLDVGENSLSKFKYDMIPNKNNIQYFYADYNNFKYIDMLFLWRVYKAEIVDFLDNPCAVHFDSNTETFSEFYDSVLQECS